MGGARSKPQVVVLNDMIFVFGVTGLDNDVPHPWAEVFDTKSCCWSPLNPPSKMPSIDRDVSAAFTAALPSTSQVLVGSTHDDFMCVYNAGSKSWEYVDNKIGFAPGFAPNKIGIALSPYDHPTVVATTLFWFQGGMLHAYDVIAKWNYSAPIEGLEDVVPVHSIVPDSDCPGPKLLCLANDDFCLVCCEYSVSEEHPDLLHCIRIFVSPVHTSGKETGFHAIVRAFQSYYFRVPLAICGAVLINESIKFEQCPTAKAALKAGGSLAPGDAGFTSLIKECYEHVAVENTELPEQFLEEISHGWIEFEDFPALICRYEFCQTPEEVVVTIFAGRLPDSNVLVDFGEQILRVTIDDPDEEAYPFAAWLFGKIIPEKCGYEVFSTEIEIRLAKAEAVHWKPLEFNKDITVLRRRNFSVGPVSSRLESNLKDISGLT